MARKKDETFRQTHADMSRDPDIHDHDREREPFPGERESDTLTGTEPGAVGGVVANRNRRPGNTPVEQQERPADQVDATRHLKIAITGPGAADFLTAPGGLDRPESGSKGMAQTRDEGLLGDPKRLAPRLGPDSEAFPGERKPEEQMTGSQTGTIGGGGPEAHNPSPNRAIRPDEDNGL
jgi:hypothetical protein